MQFFTGSYKDPASQSVSITVRNLQLDFRDLRKDGFLLNNSVLPSVLSEAVRSVPIDLESANPSTSANDSAGMLESRWNKIVECNKTNVTGCEWYETYRRGFLRWCEPAEHEFLRHYLACLLVVSTNHHEPLDQLAKLSQSQHAQQVRTHNLCSTPIRFKQKYES